MALPRGLGRRPAAAAAAAAAVAVRTTAMMTTTAGRPAVPTGTGPFATRLPARKNWDSRASNPGLYRPKSFGFAFDIDGVLLHSAKPIGNASETLRHLDRLRIPFILLTNGGGKLDRDRAAELSSLLGVDITTDMFVQSHTPFRDLAGDALSQTTSRRWKLPRGRGYGGATVLAIGSDGARCRHIMESYGFQNVIIPADILHAFPGIFPFDPFLRDVYEAQARPLPPQEHGPYVHSPLRSPVHRQRDEKACRPYRIDAVFVLDDPRDWALDIQIMTDVLVSGRGSIGPGAGLRPPSPPEANAVRPPVFFSNGDLLWSSGYPAPRLGQGAFYAAVKGIWDRLGTQKRNSPPLTVQIGKPTQLTYEYAEKVLGRRQKALVAEAVAQAEEAAAATEAEPAPVAAEDEEAADSAASPGPGLPPFGRPSDPPEVQRLQRVYMVGDNPESDIRGANQYRSLVGIRWVSMLVRTGVYSDNHPREVTDEADHKCGTVQDAVEMALGIEYVHESLRHVPIDGGPELAGES